MRRPILKLARYGLLALGVLALLCIPLSLVMPLRVELPGETKSALLLMRGGAFETHLVRDVLASHRSANWHVMRRGPREPVLALSDGWLMPRITRRVHPPDAWSPRPHTNTGLYLPLWLLAVVCLAWPVTSFIVSRKRRCGRGFRVEPAPPAVP